MAVTLTSTAAPRTIQAVLGCGTKNCSSASQAHEYFKQQFPTSQPAKAATSFWRAMARCTMGCDMAAPYTEGQDVGSVKTEGVSLGALSAWAGGVGPILKHGPRSLSEAAGNAVRVVKASTEQLVAGPAVPPPWPGLASATGHGYVEWVPRGRPYRHVVRADGQQI